MPLRGWAKLVDRCRPGLKARAWECRPFGTGMSPRRWWTGRRILDVCRCRKAPRRVRFSGRLRRLEPDNCSACREAQRRENSSFCGTRLGAEPHGGGGGPAAERHAAARRQEVVEERVDARARSMVLVPVQFTTQPTSRTVPSLEGDAQAAAGERLGRDDLGRRAGQHRRALESGDARRPTREASGGEAAPGAGVDAQELLAVALVEPLPQRLDDSAQAVHRGSPVAGGALDAREVLGGALPVVLAGAAPVVDLGDRGQLGRRRGGSGARRAATRRAGAGGYDGRGRSARGRRRPW